MSNLKTLVLMSLVAGLTAPVLASTTSNVPAEPADAELLYLSLKASGDEIPEWLNEMLFPADKDHVPADGSREGGETWADAIAITSFPYTDTGNTTDNVDNPVTMTGTPLCTSASFTTLPAKDVWYKFTLASASTMTFSLCASPWDTKLAVFVDNAGVVGNVVARDDDACNSPNGLASVISNCSLPAGDYFIVVDGYGVNNAGAYTLQVTGPCLDTACPAGYDAAYELEPVCAHTNDGCNLPVPAFEPIAFDTPTCGTTGTYVSEAGNARDTDWYEVVLTQSSTITVNGATGCVPMAYTVVNGACPAVTVGSFSVAAGGSGTYTSPCLLPGTYRVVAAPQVFSGFSCENVYYYGIEVRATPCVHPCDTYTCETLNGAGSYFGDTTGKTNIAGNAAPDDFYCFTATADCQVTFTTCSANTAYDTYLRLWSAGGPCGGGVQLAFNDDQGSTCTYNSLHSNLVYSLVAGQSYVLQVEGYSGNFGAYELIVSGDCIQTVDAVELPTAYSLKQNVPNPFNPTTTINFSMGETGAASLKVYDLTGREVATLVNRNVERGEHSVTFDASNLSSGVYFYTLQAGATVETKKMVLMK